MSASADGISLLSPAALPKVLGEALLPGVLVVSLLNRNGLLLGCAGDAQAAPAISLPSYPTCGKTLRNADSTLGCLLLECEHGRLAIKAVGSFIIACCSDTTVTFGMLKAKVLALHAFLLPALSQIA